MNHYETFIHRSRYARYIPELGRREEWHETCMRWEAFFAVKFPALTKAIEDAAAAIYKKEVMPSMRALMTAGRALERDNVAGYNCSYLPVDHPRAFDEAMYILMCGTGVGFSVERQYIAKLPEVADTMTATDTVIKVADSKIGWCTAVRELISLLYSGRIPAWDLSAVRPAGAPLKTMGGRASGPQPLDDLMHFAVALFKKAVGRRLNSVECHDLMCKIADVVVVGGVRRSAMISLSNLTDERMRNAKNGQWWEDNVQRALANNSVAYTEKPDMGIFMREWQSLYDSKSGERGIFNRNAAITKAAESGREAADFGTNPCGEIILRPHGFCNLSEVVVRPEDTLDTLRVKVYHAVLIGTLQSTLTDFRYLRPIWKRNAEEERLLGVSLTGVMDHPILSVNSMEASDILSHLRSYAKKVNKELASILGINASASITCVKPSGTVSQLVNSASGLHPRYSEYYIRTVRADIKDPLAQFLKEQGVPCEPDVTKPSSVLVFSFPIASPKESVLRDDMNAIAQLEHYLMMRDAWCDHNPSITVYVKEDEWMLVGAWVYAHFDEIGGISFLPWSDHVYKQAPYQPCSREEYEKASLSFPDIKWGNFKEAEDNVNSRELACVAGICEI
jgi:ribonucleoside-diphosphate reductase alpha chain